MPLPLQAGAGGSVCAQRERASRARCASSSSEPRTSLRPAGPVCGIMDGLRLPPLIEEVLDPSDELQEHKFLLMTEGLSEKPSEVEAHEEKRQQDEEEKDSKEELQELRAQLVQLLLKLEETREVSQQQEQSCEELLGLLEDERLASAHQAESFTRQIQTLQVQLRSVQEEAIRLQEERDGELEEVQQELRWAQEEVLVLQQAAEEAAADSENDIAYLQEELCRLKAELQSLHAAVAEYELEISALRAELKTETRNPSSAEVTQLQEEAWSLSCERQTLSGENRRLSDGVERLSDGVERLSDGVDRLQCDNVYLAIKHKHTPEPDPNVKAAQIGPEPLDSEISVLKVQLQWAEETAQKVQVECDAVKAELVELQLRYDCSQQERTSLALELQHCKAELQKVMLRRPQKCTPQPDPQSGLECQNPAVAAQSVVSVLVLVVQKNLKTLRKEAQSKLMSPWRCLQRASLDGSDPPGLCHCLMMVRLTAGVHCFKSPQRSSFWFWSLTQMQRQNRIFNKNPKLQKASGQLTGSGLRRTGPSLSCPDE
ncbi:hypothetical protein OJAV_G00225080 [Oryzias javanicus]|uniref:Uncharacterized protein n=1 Tax=Oryzias javanicus TaxID=123683 RepID=A0A437C2C5_ORYJA|nr:hypothetical protein OJAV_G00225080 [Oryzias javanicus]